MVSMSQLEQWTPSALSDAADDLLRQRKVLQDVKEKLSRGRPPANWMGEHADDTRKKHSDLEDRIDEVTSEMSSVIFELDHASSRIRSAQESLADWKSTANSSDMKVTESGSGIEVTPPPAAPTSGHTGSTYDQLQQNSLAAEIASGISDVLQKASDADADLASCLSHAASGHMTLLQAGEGVFGNLERDGSKAWAWAKEHGKLAVKAAATGIKAGAKKLWGKAANAFANPILEKAIGGFHPSIDDALKLDRVSAGTPIIGGLISGAVSGGEQWWDDRNKGYSLSTELGRVAVKGVSVGVGSYVGEVGGTIGGAVVGGLAGSESGPGAIITGGGGALVGGMAGGMLGSWGGGKLGDVINDHWLNGK